MGDGPGFMIVVVHRINPQGTEIDPASNGIHVGSIHVHQATFRVNQCGNVCEMPFKHSRGIGVRDHNARNAPPVAIKELVQVIHSDLAVRTSMNLYHARESFSAALHRFKSSHGGCSRVCTMGGMRDEDNVTLPITPAAVISLKHFETH